MDVLNWIQQAFTKLSTFFTLSTMLNDLFKRPQHLVQQSVELMLKQMLKLFKRVLIQHNMVKNPSWQGADTERDLNPGSPDYNFDALITRPRCPSASHILGK